MKAGDVAYLKVVGYGLVSFESDRVERVARGKVKLLGSDTQFNATSGDGAGDPYGLGLVITLCVSEKDIAVAKRYIAENGDAP